MAWTKADLEAELWEAFGPYFNLVKLDTMNEFGTRPGLHSIIRDAVEASGGTIANPPEVTDTDVATMQLGHLGYQKVASLYALEKIWGNWAKVDVKGGLTEQKLNQIAERIQAKIKAIQAELADPDSPTSIITTPIPASDIGVMIAGIVIPHDPFAPYTWTGNRRFPY